MREACESTPPERGRRLALTRRAVADTRGRRRSATCQPTDDEAAGIIGDEAQRTSVARGGTCELSADTRQPGRVMPMVCYLTRSG